ncbi:MAG: glucose-6-phosphate dehydrogenase [Pseudomonadota bacterium]
MSDSARADTSQLLPVAPFDIVVFGATGDLALRKLIPSLYHRFLDGQIADHSRIIGAARSEMTIEAFRDLAGESFQTFHANEPFDPDRWSKFAELIHYAQVDAANAEASWDDLAHYFSNSSDEAKIRIFYLALPPGIYGVVSRNIEQAGLRSEQSRIVLEKPIGSDLQSARSVNDAVGAVFPEDAIFRIDHYLGKETVQNLIVLRFMNSLFEPVWNANNIDHVQITVAEAIGAGQRAGYYDKAGALRDMVQNHLLQLLCLVGMEPPLDLEADTIRDEKIKVLRALKPVTAAAASETTVRGHYSAGAVNGEAVPGYLEELGGPSSSETFVALKAEIQNWRWQGTPFYLRTGKRMSGRRSEIVIQFKPVAHNLLGNGYGKLHPTRLVIRLQPDEGVRLLLMTKDPGPGGMRLRYVPLNLSYAEQFAAHYPDAYERLLMAVVRDDLGLFMRRDEVEAAWQWVDGVLAAWDQDETEIHGYAAGTDGPAKSVSLMDRDGRSWFDGD